MKKTSKKHIMIICAVIAAVVLLSTAVYGYIKLSDDTFRFNTPTVIKANSKTAGVINDKDDYEAYLIELPKNGALTVRFDHADMADTLKEGWRITLYKISEPVNGEYSYDELGYFSSFWSDVTSSWGETGLAAGDYIILVESGEFNLSKEFTLVTAFTPTEWYEREFNDTPETATPIKTGSNYYGASLQRTEGGDDDYYKFEIEKDCYVELLFSHENKSLPSVAWVVSLVDESGISILDFSSKLSDPLLTSGKVGVKAGTYYAKVESQLPFGNTYQIKIETGDRANSEFEVNDTPEQATLLEVDENITGCLSPRVLGLDKDYYKINLEEDGYINLYFSHTKLEDADKKGWNVRLFKPDEKHGYYEITKSVSYWDDAGFILKEIGLSAGEYYICVDADGVNYNSDTYGLCWMFTERGDYEKEPNDFFTRANDIELSKFYYGKLITKDIDFDDDYYTFTLDEPKNVSVELYHDIIKDSSVAWSLTLSDEDDDKIVTVLSSKDESVTVTGVQQLPAGKYFVHVETGMSESDFSYRIRVVG